eukprot:3270588-Rhodomonas_salina.2
MWGAISGISDISAAGDMCSPRSLDVTRSVVSCGHRSARLLGRVQVGLRDEPDLRWRSRIQYQRIQMA